MPILDTKQLNAKYESLRNSIGNKYHVYLNKPNGILRACFTDKHELSIVELEEILRVAKEMAQLESLKNIHAELVKGGLDA